MATLYVENVPEELYEALRNLAKRERRSIAAEVIYLLETNVPTEKVLKARLVTFEKMKKLRRMPPASPGPFPSAEEMVREDRER